MPAAVINIVLKFARLLLYNLNQINHYINLFCNFQESHLYHYILK